MAHTHRLLQLAIGAKHVQWATTQWLLAGRTVIRAPWVPALLVQMCTVINAQRANTLPVQARVSLVQWEPMQAGLGYLRALSAALEHMPLLRALLSAAHVPPDSMLMYRVFRFANNAPVARPAISLALDATHVLKEDILQLIQVMNMNMK